MKLAPDSSAPVVPAIAALARAIGKVAQSDGDYKTAIAALSLHRRKGPTDPLHCIFSLGLGVVAQGDKQALLGSEVVTYGPGQSMLTTIDLPVISHVTRASTQEPLLGLMLTLDSQEIVQTAADMQLPVVGQVLRAMEAARFASTRYPGKPLVALTGAKGVARSLIERSVMAGRAASCGQIPIYVATDDDRIADEARRIGADVIMTSDTCRNGTERVAEAVAGAGSDQRQARPRGHDEFLAGRARAAVVRHHHDIAAQCLRHGVQQLGFDDGADIAGQQRAATGGLDPQHAAGLVAEIGKPRGRMQHAEADAVPVPGLAGDARGDAGRGTARRRQQRRHRERLGHG